MENKPDHQNTPPPRIKDILFMPMGCLLQLTNPVLMIITTLVIAAIAWFAFFSSNPIQSIYYSTSNLEFSEGFGSITASEGSKKWHIQYERTQNTTFEGYIRHNSAINEKAFPMLTNDILVTTGDFAQKSLVNTSVSNHRFRWVSLNNNYPSGTINLLHAIPLNQEIYQLLGSIKSGDEVIIEGREILKINYEKDGEILSFWSDAGCNTLVVTRVIIKP